VLGAHANNASRAMTQFAQRLTHQPHLPIVARQKLAHNVEHGGFATAVGAEKTHHLTWPDPQAKTIQHMVAAKPLVNVVDF
jgi:hypothetical protein